MQNAAEQKKLGGELTLGLVGCRNGVVGSVGQTL
jgi:hypothetical protein